jgi:hypothetical protein
MDVGMLRIPVIDRDPVELRAEIPLGLRYQIPREGLQVGQPFGIVGGLDVGSPIERRQDLPLRLFLPVRSAFTPSARHAWAEGRHRHMIGPWLRTHDCPVVTREHDTSSDAGRWHACCRGSSAVRSATRSVGHAGQGTASAGSSESPRRPSGAEPPQPAAGTNVSVAGVRLISG